MHQQSVNTDLAAGNGHCSLVASLGVNLLRDLQRVQDLISIAIEARFDAVVVPWAQGCSASGRATGQPAQGQGLSLEQLRSLRQRCQKYIAFVGAPHDEVSLAQLDGLALDAYQIEPALLSHGPLLRAVASTRRPVLVACGMCSDSEIEAALHLLEGCKATLLHCVAAQQVPLESTALSAIPYLTQRYRLPVGFLDTSEDGLASLAALVLGAQVIETPLGPSSPSGWRGLGVEQQIGSHLVQQLRSLEASLTPLSQRNVLPLELDNAASQRPCLVATMDLTAGTRLTAEMLASGPPLGGLSPAMLHQVVGKLLVYDLAAGQPLTFGLVEP